MKTLSMDMKKYAPIVVRLAIALVFLWFGSNQIMAPGEWFGYLPGFVPEQSMAMFVTFNGIGEIILGLLLVMGLFTRIVALLLALHLLGIIFFVGYNEIGVRDFGLMLAALSIALQGHDSWCFDARFSRKA